MNISSKHKHLLKGLAHSIKPSVIIGKDGLSSGTINSISNILEYKELIKIKFNDFKEQKSTLAKQIENECEAIIIGKVGNIFIFFKQNDDIEKRNYLFK